MSDARIDAVTPQQIVEQREAGWPDCHPEEFCHLCGRLNLRSWYVDSSLWNAAQIEDEQERRGFRRSGIVCPQCFEGLLDAAGGGHCTWELRPDSDTTHHLRDDLRASECEKLRAALAALVELIEARHVEPDDDAFVAARALVGSVPQTPPAMVCVGCGAPVGGIEPTQHAEGCRKPGTKLAPPNESTKEPG